MDEKKLSRRAFIRGAAGVAGVGLAGTIIPIQVQAQAKIAKDVMKYQDTPKDGQRCDECTYWQPPNKCGLVEGDIKPEGWCTAWNKKK